MLNPSIKGFEPQKLSLGTFSHHHEQNDPNIYISFPLQPHRSTDDQVWGCNRWASGDFPNFPSPQTDSSTYIVATDEAYLIFVIFFTRAKFLENKIYTEKARKLRQNTQ